MTKMKIALRLLSLLLVLCFLALMSIESYCWFSPHIDTNFSDSFSIDTFHNIQVGDTKEKVSQSLGQPLQLGGCGISLGDTEHRGNLDSRMMPCEPGDDEIWQYSDDNACTWWDFAWEYYALVFRDGVLVVKENYWRYD